MSRGALICSYDVLCPFEHDKTLIFLKHAFKLIDLCECNEFLFHLNKGYEMLTYLDLLKCLQNVSSTTFV
jgi:hypothetical protein